MNSRHQKRLNHVWRRRHCLDCRAVFTTLEEVLLASCLMLRKDNGQLISFEKEKLLISVYESCRHRKSAITDAAALTDDCIALLLDEAESGSIDQSKLVHVVYSSLSHFDKAAAVHYLAYHGEA